MSTLASVTPISPWRTDTFRRLAVKLERVLGARTAKSFEPLKLRTVGDLMQHLPRRYFSGTELSDLSQLQPDEEAAVMAIVVRTRSFNTPGDAGYRPGQKPRLEAVVTDHRGYLTLTFFGKPQLISYWKRQLEPGARGIFAGKVREFNGQLQLAHPEFVILSDSDERRAGNAALAAASQAPLVGLYPASGKLRTWTIAESVGLALATLDDVADPLPEWVRSEADVEELGPALHAVHQPRDRDQVERGRDRLRFDEAFGLQLTMARRRSRRGSSGCGGPPDPTRRAAGRIRCPVAVHADRRAGRGQ